MRAVVQRVSRAKVTVAEEITGEIGRALARLLRRGAVGEVAVGAEGHRSV